MKRQGANRPGISTDALRDGVLDIRRLDDMVSAGFSHIELVANRPHVDYHARPVHQALAGWARSNPSVTLSLHLPFLEHTGKASFRWISALAPEQGARTAGMDEIKRALELSDHFPVAWVVVHLGIPGQDFNPVHFDYAYALMDMIRRFAGVRIMIENIPNAISSPTRILELLQVVELPDIRICYDTGHCHLTGFPWEFEHIGAVHLNDNDGHTDQHRWPFEGTIDWGDCALQLARAGFAGPLVVEGSGPDPGTAFDAVVRFADMILEAHESVDGTRESDNSDRRPRTQSTTSPATTGGQRQQPEQR